MPDISLWPECNSNCIMCTNPDFFIRNDINAKYTFEAIKGRLDRYKQGNEEFSKFNDVSSTFTFTGGESTLNPDLFRIIKYAYEQFPHSRMDLLTNGRRFSDETFAQKCLRLFPDMYYVMPLHGYDARMHDAIMRAPGSFDQVMAGVKNLFKYGLSPDNMEIRVVILGINYQYLDKICETIRREWPQVKRIIWIFFEPEGQAKKNLNVVKVTYNETTPYVKRLAKYAGFFEVFRLYHFPLCTQDPVVWPLIDRTLDKNERSFVQACTDCKVRKYCLGVHNEYIDNFGIKEISPITKDYEIEPGITWYNPIAAVKNLKDL